MGSAIQLSAMLMRSPLPKPSTWFRAPLQAVHLYFPKQLREPGTAGEEKGNKKCYLSPKNGVNNILSSHSSTVRLCLLLDYDKRSETPSFLFFILSPSVPHLFREKVAKKTKNVLLPGFKEEPERREISIFFLSWGRGGGY